MHTATLEFKDFASKRSSLAKAQCPTLGNFLRRMMKADQYLCSADDGPEGGDVPARSSARNSATSGAERQRWHTDHGLICQLLRSECFAATWTAAKRSVLQMEPNVSAARYLRIASTRHSRYAGE